jgi:hypothetical protein
MKFSSFYTTANTANALSPFAKEGDGHFFDQPDFDSRQNEVEDEERPFAQEKDGSSSNEVSPWQGSNLYGAAPMKAEEDVIGNAEKTKPGNPFQNGEAGLNQTTAEQAGTLLPDTEGLEQTGLKVPEQNGLAGSSLAGMQDFNQIGAEDLSKTGILDFDKNGTAGVSKSGVAGLNQDALPGLNQAGTENFLQPGSKGFNPTGIQISKQPGPAVPAQAATALQQTTGTDSQPAGAGKEQAADTDTEQVASTTSSAGASTTEEAGSSRAEAPASTTNSGPASNIDAANNAPTDRINAGRDVDFKPTIQTQAAIIEADSDITQQEIIRLANERRGQVSDLFAGSRANVTASIEGNAFAVQEIMLSQQASVMAVAVNSISSIQALIASATVNAQALVQTYQAAIGSVVANATQSVQDGITGVASEITGLINSVSLPDLPGLATVRGMVVSLINNGASAVNSALTGMLSMIGNILQFGLGLLHGFIGMFGALLGQAFAMVSNGIMTMLNLLISSFNAILNIVLSNLRNLLHAVILPLLSQIEGLVMQQIGVAEQEHLQQVRSNRDQHLEMLANILDPTAASAGAAGAGSGGADPGWTIEKIGLSAVNNNHALISNFTRVVNQIFGNIVTDITTAVTRVITEINMRVNQFLTAVISLVTQVVQLIYSLVAAVIQFLMMIIAELMMALSGLLNFITNALSNPVTAVISAARGVLSRVRSAISNIVNSFLNGIGPGSAPAISSPVVSSSFAGGGPTPAFAGGPIIIIGGKVIIIIGTAFFIISTTVAIIILVVVVIVLLILLYLLYKWLTKPAPAPPPPPPPPPPPKGNEYSPGTPLVQEHAIPRRQQDIQVSKGEKMLFGFIGNDKDQVRPIGTPAWTEFPGKGPYEIEWEVKGDADLFDPDSGIKGFTDPSKSSINLDVFVSNAWTGSPLSITATFRDNALPAAPPDIGTTKDANDFAVEWTLKPRTNPCPQELKRVAGADGSAWVKAPALYTYQGMPHLGPPGTPSYEGQTLLESFITPTALNFTMDDLKPDWKAAHPDLNTPDKVAGYLWNSGFNSTFVFNSKDQISDQHSGFGTIEPFLQSALDRPEGIGYRLPQIYTCDSKTIGTADIDRRISTASGIEVRKNGPS